MLVRVFVPHLLRHLGGAPFNDPGLFFRLGSRDVNGSSTHFDLVTESAEKGSAGGADCVEEPSQDKKRGAT